MSNKYKASTELSTRKQITNKHRFTIQTDRTDLKNNSRTK